MEKTYLDGIRFGLEDGRFLLGLGLGELYYTKLSPQATDTGDDGSNDVSQGHKKEADTIGPGDSNDNDTADETNWSDPEKKEYTRVEMGFSETPLEDVQYGVDTFRFIYDGLQILTKPDPKLEDFSISPKGHRFQPLFQMTKDIAQYGESFLVLFDKFEDENQQQRHQLIYYHDQLMDILNKLQDYLLEPEQFTL